jgi:hypothetical protein
MTADRDINGKMAENKPVNQVVGNWSVAAASWLALSA